MIIHEEDKEVFLKTLNKKGFLLEDKVWKILEGLSFNEINRSVVIDKDSERVEIDFVLNSENHCIIGECKRTDYSWVFAKALERAKTLNLMYKEAEGIQKMEVKSRGTSDFDVAWTDLEIIFDENGRVIKNNNGFIKTSRDTDDNIHKAIRQVLKEVGAYLGYRAIRPNQMIIPLIVTNTDLYYLEYSKGDINERGDLINYNNIREVKGIAYNFPEVIKYGNMDRKVGDSRHEIKTVFIVNVKYLDEFIKLIFDQQI